MGFTTTKDDKENDLSVFEKKQGEFIVLSPIEKELLKRIEALEKK